MAAPAAAAPRPAAPRRQQPVRAPFPAPRLPAILLAVSRARLAAPEIVHQAATKEPLQSQRSHFERRSGLVGTSQTVQEDAPLPCFRACVTVKSSGSLTD